MALVKRREKKDGRFWLYVCGLRIAPIRMKLGVSYNCFDGEELLESSILSIRQSVDYINVVYQRVSNFGQAADAAVEPLLADLKARGLIDEVVLYEPTLSTPQANERAKRDIGLAYAKRAGCTHFMSMDVDEFYKADELNRAKREILKKNIDSSAAGVVEYLKEPTVQMINSYTYTRNQEFYTFYVPFIIKIRRFGRQKHGISNFPCLVDPTRGLGNVKRFYLFPMQDLAMHHMSTVRRDLASKYRNSSFMNSPPAVQEYVQSLQQQILHFDFEENKAKLRDYSMFNQSFIRKVDNLFNIRITPKK